MKRLLILVLFAVALSGTARADENGAFWLLSREILGGIDQAPMGSLPAGSGYGAPRIAVSTVAETGKPTDKGDELSRRLLYNLQKNANGRYRFVATDALDDLIVSIRKDGLSDEESRARIRDLRANARPDVLVVGTYRLVGGETRLSYQAVSSDTGELLASAETTFLEQPILPAAGPQPTLQPTLRRPADQAYLARPAPTLPQRRVVTTETPAPTGIYRSTVEEAERYLFDKGYDPGPVDGYMTEQTRQALRAYQLDSALPANGRLTRRTVDNLRRDTRGLPL